MDNGANSLSRLSFTDLETPKLIVIDDVDGDGEFSIKRLLPELGAVIAKDYQRGAWYDGATFCERNETAH
jgi:hypothetical protein